VEEPLLAPLEDHLPSERLAARLVAAGGEGREAAAAMALLKTRKKSHADAEERELFPRARALLPPDRLEALGRCMENVADRLMGPGVGARERIAARRVLA
jgi:hypothetical protein